MSEQDYWNKFYTSTGAPSFGSTFAQWVISKMDKSLFVLEAGCGNGRDSFHFASQGFKTIGVDIADAEIKILQNKVKDSPSDVNTPIFLAGDFTAMAGSPALEGKSIGTIYSRFTLHAINRKDADLFLAFSYEQLPKNGLLLIEVRSVLDPLCGTGTPVEGEKDAWINTHYRRFVRKDELVAELEKLGFTLEEVVEADNLAVYKDDNPVVIRVVARKL